jgi:OOP family OmpA-OmpF porin
VVVAGRVDEKGCYIELEETVTIDLNLEFDTDSYDLRVDHYVEIQRVVQFLREYPTANAVVEGHTDSDGSEAYNQALSERRAASVRVYLVEQGGMNADRLASVGYGEMRPVAANDSPAGKQSNRRVSAVVSGSQTVRQ